MDFKYKVSVIVPVYNVEDYLRDCLDSLLAQTIDHREMEVLLINDGSTDHSLDICYEYAQSHFIFKVFTQENQGVSAARNVGIKNAQGKYIAFLDSDDMLSSETLSNVMKFFDVNYDRTDLVTFPINKYSLTGEKLPYYHYRFDILKESKVYSLESFPYITQTTMNIVVKHDAIGNIEFDKTMIVHEDQKFINMILMKQQTIGFVKNAEYKYISRNDSAMGNNFSPIELFEPTTNYYEELFGKYTDVPKYLQGMFIHDCNWKLRDNVLFPYHYEPKEFNIAMKRIQSLLSKVEKSIILNHPGVDYYHKYYFLKLKGVPLTSYVLPDKLMLLNNEEVVHSQNVIELVFNSIKIINDKINIVGVIKTVILEHVQKPIFKMNILDNTDVISEEFIELFESPESYYRCRTKTNLMYGFIADVDIKNVKKLWFNVIIDNLVYNTSFYFMKNCPMAMKTDFCFLSGYYITNKNNSLTIEKINEKKYFNILEEKRNGISDDFLKFYQDAQRYREKIWLYYDCAGVEKDNGYYQFLHDIHKKDGIQRYYIYANDPDKLPAELDNYRDNIVMFGSYKHKVLYLAAQKIITAFIEEKNYNPFEGDNYYQLVLNSSCHEIIYLQHGILHAHVPWKYAPGRITCDKIVVSSYFEIHNFHETYHFPLKMLIQSGMPRFDHISCDMKQSNRILFAPSWRSYLIGDAVGNNWNLTETKFLNSKYYKIFNNFLNSEKLEKILEENDIYIDFKIHPIFKPYLNLFDNHNKHVQFANDSVKDEDYAMFITDFSSFVFDFAFLCKPILYFVPDYTEFKAGLNQYRELDLPFEKAFGRFVTDSEDAIEEIFRNIKNKFIAEPIYKERMQSFYLPLNGCCENIYSSISE